ncbi:MAG: MotA/TolQ/ExbB proton channel family protein [Bacteroidales bacterium]|nr:MotA/TolQ/ExbB proton channel family protein [Bacteroidales bacterium]
MLLTTFLQTSADEIATTVNEVAEDASFSLLGMASKGGWLMIVLAILSIVAIYVFAERLYAINHASKVDKNFTKDITDYLQDGKKKSALALCKKSDTPIARMLEKGIERMGRPLHDIQAAVENVGNLEVARLEKGLPVLASIAGGAPMIGFLGTVMGMVQAFFNMSRAGNNIDITLLSGGIYTAMITTVGGLIVGIIAYFCYNYLTSRVSDVVYKMENSTIEFMDALESGSISSSHTSGSMDLDVE